jgi:hypothetical protein
MEFLIRYTIFAVLTIGLVFIPLKKWEAHLRKILIGYFSIAGIVFMI